MPSMFRSTCLLAVAALSLPSVGCKGPFYAPYTATISADIDTVYVANSPSFWYADGVGSALKMHLLVTKTGSDGSPMPLNNVWVEVQGPTSGVYLLPESAVQTLRYPDAAQANTSSCYDEDGNLLNDGENEWCGWYVDTVNGSYIQVTPSYADAAGFTEDGQPFGPNYVRAATNDFGRLDLWMFVDALPTRVDGGAGGGSDTGGGDTGLGGIDPNAVELGDAIVTASTGYDSTSVVITAAQ
jgi:predicted small lipoprotein YifL